MFEVSLLSLLSLPSPLQFLQTDHELTKKQKNTGQWKRALVSALSVGLGAIGGVTGYVLLLLLLHLLLFIHHQYHLFPSSETTTTD